ncbi:MAG: uroporphyrinogen-III C-methyltransferase [Oculatellaceae cyanobacterium Prado106]|nr:uroporphyrinogen-III C-methyltransferase [Oculatellaceae cyanobacterium Prado106]
MTGKVYIVGSGVGSFAYLTVRGQQLLQQAEVVVYDALVDGALLQAAAGCVWVDVGKRGGQPSTPQGEIDRLLVAYCQQGKQVVRLKSGDPFIFGRTTSEIQALQAAGCDFEVVPGVSSALAAPLLAGIPLTDPVLSRCFAVLSAHEPEELEWSALAQLETLVILMGTQHLGEIVEQLLRHGRSPQTAIAIIRWAGRPEQQIWSGTLENIVQKTSRQALSPAVMVLGEVVRLRPFLQNPAALHPNSLHNSQLASSEQLSDSGTRPSFGQSGDVRSPHPLNRSSQPLVSDFVSDSSAVSSVIATPPPLESSRPSRPLTGKTIVVTRAAGQSSQFTQLLQQQGATVLEMPTLEITAPSSWDGLDGAIAQLPTYHWLILTSTNGVEYFFDRLMAQGKDARALAGLKIAVVGQKTAACLQKWGLQADYIPPDFVADALVEHFPERDRLSGLKILFPRVESGGREVLVKELSAQGAIVTEVAAYQSGCATAVDAEVAIAFQNNQVDVLTFASSKTVKCFCQLMPAWTDLQKQGTASSIGIASIGPQTSISCQELLGRVDVEATEYTLEGLTAAIVNWAKARASQI